LGGLGMLWIYEEEERFFYVLIGFYFDLRTNLRCVVFNGMPLQ
jgi:hypothetical protein